MKNYKAIADFRLNEWPKAQASYTKYFMKHMAVHDLTPAVDFLAKALFTSRRALVRYSIFTLTNISFPKSHISYGTMPAPHKSLYDMTDIALTFAFTRDVAYDSNTKPAYSLRLGKGVYLWGTQFSRSTDYLTINLPMSVSRTMNIGTLTTDLEFLYYTLGPWSKNFVRHYEYYLPDKVYTNKEVSSTIAKGSRYGINIPDLMHRYPYNEWKYNKELWDRLPSIINPLSVDDNFCEFYCLYLTGYYGKYKVDNITQIERKVVDYLETAVLDLLSLLSGQSDPSSDIDKQNGRSLVYLLTGKDSISLETFALELLAEGNLNKITGYTLFFSDVKGAIDKLLQGRIST